MAGRQELRWEEACRAWNGAADDVDGSLARYREPQHGAGGRTVVVRRHAWAAIARARSALTGLERALTADEVDEAHEDASGEVAMRPRVLS